MFLERLMSVQGWYAIVRWVRSEGGTSHHAEPSGLGFAVEEELHAHLVGAGRGGGQARGGDIVAVTELELLGVEAQQHDERVAGAVPHPGGDRSVVHVEAQVQLTERGLLLV